MANDSVVTQDTLQEFYNKKVYSFLNGSADFGSTPIGTIISIMSNEAPENYLVCDGTIYNISDYSDLANFFEDQFGSKNYFGGDGTTTFAVPDIRGEFLRGSGTNSHTEQGSGGDVGEHQDGTEQFNNRIANNKIYHYFNSNDVAANNSDVDIWKGTSYMFMGSNKTSLNNSPNRFIARPTNTSVLYCIAYKNIFFSSDIGGYPIEINNPIDGQIIMYDATNQKWINVCNDRVRKDITNELSNLSQAVAEQNLAKYGYAIGDYFTGTSGYTYILADEDTFYGGYNSYAVVDTHHIGIVVDTGQSIKWNNSDSTNSGYVGSNLHTYLKGTALDNIKSDFIELFGGSTGLEHLLFHSKLYTKNTSPTWEWSTDQYISALTEIQVFGSSVYGLNGYQNGEACKQLKVFDKFEYNLLFGYINIWLRSINTSSNACVANSNDYPGFAGTSAAWGAVGLILFY